MAESANMLSFVCAQCGAHAERAYRGSGVRPTLCGNACKVARYKSRHPDSVRVSRGRDADARHKKQRTQLHQDILMYRKWARRTKVQARRVQHAPRAKTCRECGAAVPKGKQRCSPCRLEMKAQAQIRMKASHAYKASRRKAKACRRAIERGARAERFDPFEIFQRDGWRCHICRVKTPKCLRGTYEDNAPELDHIIPLAVSGEHTRINCACACRKCNIEKGARPLGQLRLAA